MKSLQAAPAAYPYRSALPGELEDSDACSTCTRGGGELRRVGAAGPGGCRRDLIAGSDCCQEGCFYVFRRLKDGGFAPRQKVKPVFPPEQFGRVRPDALATRVAVGDLNGDGKPDVLIGGRDRGFLGVVYGPLAGK